MSLPHGKLNETV